MAAAVLVISDSICRPLGGLLDATVKAFGGLTTSGLMDKLERGEGEVVELVRRAKLVILHVGTNDVDNYVSRGIVNNIVLNFNIITQHLLVYNPMCHIMISSIIPRPKDFPVTNPVIKVTNKELRVFCKSHPRVHFLSTHSIFFSGGGLKLEVLSPDQGFKWFHRDGLHLSDTGAVHMMRLFANSCHLWVQGKIRFS